jgi:triacylglycerol lipase
MATICAYRCQKSAIASDPHELHTFGSPRVGCKRYVRHAQVTHYRWVHNNDIVTRVPPVWMGYRHSGSELYLDRYGRIRQLTGVLRSRDRWRGMIGGLLKWRLDLLTDHSIKLYAGHIATAVKQEHAGLAKNRAAAKAEDLAIPAENDETVCTAE